MGLAASCVASIVAVSLIGASGAVLLLLAGLLTAVLVLDEELSRRAGRLMCRREVRRRTASGRPIPVVQRER